MEIDCRLAFLATTESFDPGAMHLSKDYITQVVAGDLQHPPLQNQPAIHANAAFAREINETGVYVHKLHTSTGTITQQFNKIKDQKIPTPCTFIGVGAHRIYNHNSWRNTSGLAFLPSSASLLSYKGDICSVNIIGQPGLKDFSSFTQGNRSERLAAYAEHLTSIYNAHPWQTTSAFNNRTPKKLRLVEDAAFAKAKYQELEFRSSLAYRKPADPLPSHLIDQSSKYTIAKLVTPSKPASSWTKKDLLTELQRISDADPVLRKILKHAMLKLHRFDNDGAVRNYLQRGLQPAMKQDHYKAVIQEWGAQTANEHLLMPTMDELCGICVNVNDLFGIDQALAINAELKKRQKALAKKDDGAPALTYQLSSKEGKSVIQLSWSQHVIPWSTEGLITYAKTGKVQARLGEEFHPDHFLLIDKLAEAANVIFFCDNKVINQCKAEHNCIDDLSRVNEGQSNLLHLAIENKRNIDFIKLLFFWKVNAFTQKNAQGLTALDLAHKTYPDAHRFLGEAQTWNDPQTLAENRNAYITKRLNAIHAGQGNYSLRNGWSEKGPVSFIPELGTYRVVDGEYVHDAAPDVCYVGHRSFDVISGDTAMSMGVRKSQGRTTALGVWQLLEADKSSQPTLRIGLALNAPNMQAAGLRRLEAFRQESNESSQAAIMQFTFQDSNGGFDTFELESSFLATGQAGNPDPQSCGYVKSVVKLPTDAMASAHAMVADNKLPLVSIRRSNIDRTLDQWDQRLIWCKITLAELRYLKSWQARFAAMSDQEVATFQRLAPQFPVKVAEAVDYKNKWLDHFVRLHASNLTQELVKTDAAGYTLVQEIAKHYVSSTTPEHAPYQFTLGQILEQVPQARSMARDLYKRSAHHSYTGASDALARMRSSRPSASTSPMAATNTAVVPGKVKKSLFQRIVRKIGKIFD